MDGRYEEEEEEYDNVEDIFKWDKTDSDCKLLELINFTAAFTN